MFGVGYRVIVNSFSTPKVGTIVQYYYDEGDVWVVEIDGAKYECCNSELSPVVSQ